MHNNGATHHFQALAHHVMELLARADRHRDRAQYTTNAVLFLRILVKHLAENLNAAHLVAFVNDPAPPGLPNGAAGVKSFPDSTCLCIRQCQEQLCLAWASPGSAMQSVYSVPRLEPPAQQQGGC